MSDTNKVRLAMVILGIASVPVIIALTPFLP